MKKLLLFLSFFPLAAAEIEKRGTAFYFQKAGTQIQLPVDTAQALYGHLWESPYFPNGNKEEAAEQFRVLCQQIGAQRMRFAGDAGITVDAIFCKGKSPSKTCVLVAPPICAEEYQMGAYAGTFEADDKLLLLPPWTEKEAHGHFWKNLGFGFLRHPKPAVYAALNWCEQKGYEKIVGMGPCYGGLLLAGVQYECEQSGRRGFDSLILESTVLRDGRETVARKYDKRYKKLPSWCQNALNMIGVKECLKNCLIGLFAQPEDPNMPESLKSLLPKLKIPVLGLYGTNDSQVPTADVINLFDQCNDENKKLCLFEHVGHLHPHWWSRAMCAWVANRFINEEQ